MNYKTTLTEDVLQTQCVAFFRVKYPKSIIFAIANGGSRHPLEAYKLKRTGVLAGVPDLFIPEPKGGYPGAFIEMKSAKGKLSAAQAVMVGCLKERGYLCEVCRDFEGFEKVVTEYMQGN